MKKITFCLMTCGEETEQDCLRAIEPFMDHIVLQEVRNVYPQIKALNQMLLQAETEFLIPLDSDIVLNENAFERIQRSIDKFGHDEQWHSILFKLYDTLTEKEILALKILRTKIVKQFPFRETATPDIEHFRRLTDAGYKCIDQLLVKNPIGKHVVKGKHFCYNKYKDVYKTLKVHGWEWDQGVFFGGKTIVEKAQNHFNYFLYKYIQTSNTDYLWCIGGILESLNNKSMNISKDLSDHDYLYDNESDVLDALIDWQYLHYKSYIANPFF